MLLQVLGVLLATAAPAATTPGPAKPRNATEREARAFLETVSGLYQAVSRAASEAAWRALTDVSPVHEAQRAGAEGSATALAGARIVIEKGQALLAQPRRLDPLTLRQLRRLLLTAAENPGTLPEVVARRAEAEQRQASLQQGFGYCVDAAPPAGGRCARPATAGQLDEVLRRSDDLEERRRAWEASKEVGRPLRPGLEALVPLRNQIAREMGYSSFFALQVADYGMTVPEMTALLDDTLQATAPLYSALHCWARHTLAGRFKQPVPALLPAHWLGNRWAQSWPGLVAGADLDRLFAGRSGESIVRQAETFFVSLGFARLPETFWQKSDLYPVPGGAGRKKIGHASAWHIDGDRDVRSLMNVEPSLHWFGTAHHELAHVYYYLAYTRPEVPYLLRAG
jgi:peptidyl-dipeptidase A